jgi:hypothetical protein
MKALLVLLMLSLSFQAYSHCGTCGSGSADDHSSSEDSSQYKKYKEKKCKEGDKKYCEDDESSDDE